MDTPLTPLPEAAPGTLSTVDDAELVDAFVAQASDSALVELIRRYQIPVYRRLATRLSDPDQAEGACELFFVLMSQRLEEWPREMPLRTWLFERVDELGPNLDAGKAATDEPRFLDPAIFFRHAVHRALGELEDDQREILVAVDLEQQSVEEVAKERSLPEKKVTETLDIARERFQEAPQIPAPSAAAPDAP
jgi:DNA-directed RNA polymerase specialized sigma24 family protein